MSNVDNLPATDRRAPRFNIAVTIQMRTLVKKAVTAPRDLADCKKNTSHALFDDQVTRYDGCFDINNGGDAPAATRAFGVELVVCVSSSINSAGVPGCCWSLSICDSLCRPGT